MQMKRIILLSFVSMLLSVGTTMAEGISSARELVAFATAANAGEDITPWADREGVISLTADIDMAKVKAVSYTHLTLPTNREG